MKVDLKYQNAFTEALVILKTLNKKDYNKIPKDIIKALEENKNTKHHYGMNDENDLQEQPMLPQTRALLFNIFRDYLATPEQKNKILKMQRQEREKLEQRKKQIFGVELFSRKK